MSLQACIQEPKAVVKMSGIARAVCKIDIFPLPCSICVLGLRVELYSRLLFLVFIIVTSSLLIILNMIVFFLLHKLIFGRRTMRWYEGIDFLFLLFIVTNNSTNNSKYYDCLFLTQAHFRTTNYEV